MTKNSSWILEQGCVPGAAISTSDPAWGRYQPSSIHCSLWMFFSCAPLPSRPSNQQQCTADWKTVLTTSAIMKELFFHIDGTPYSLLPSKLHSSLYPDIAEGLFLGPAGWNRLTGLMLEQLCPSLAEITLCSAAVLLWKLSFCPFIPSAANQSVGEARSSLFLKRANKALCSCTLSELCFQLSIQSSVCASQCLH